MANPATSMHPVRPPGPWDAVKITNRPNGIAGMLGFKRVVILLDGVESEPIWNVLENDPLTTLQAGEVIEAYFKSEDKVKKLGIISIDCRMDAALGGYDVTIVTQEYQPGLVFVPGSTVNGPPGQNNLVKSASYAMPPAATTNRSASYLLPDDLLIPIKGICMRCNAPTYRNVRVGYVCENCA